MTTIVLLPGLGSSEELWTPCMQVLRRKGVRVVCADYRDLDDVGAMAARAVSLVEGMILPVGLSMGGYVALEIVRQYPDRVSGLGLCCTTAKADSEQRKQERLAEIAAGAAAYASKRQLDSHFQYYLAPAHQNRVEIIDCMRRMDAEAGFETQARHAKACMNRLDSRAMLERITLPTLIFGGKNDPLFPVATHVELFQSMQEAYLVLAPHCGHVASLEQPEFLAEVLDQHYRLCC